MSPDTLRAYPSPGGHAVLLYADTPTLDRVLLATRGDTTEAFSWGIDRPLGIEWLTDDLGRIRVPVGGNHHSAAVYVQASSGRVSPPLDDAVAVDAGAGTAVTYDGDGFTLHDVWTGRALATWTPAGRGVAGVRALGRAGGPDGHPPL